MGKPNFSEDFKRDAVHQITVRGMPFARFRNGWASVHIRSTNG